MEKFLKILIISTLFKDLMESNNLENNIKCTECELIFDSVEKMSFHFYEAHEKKIIEKSELNKEWNMNMKRIEINKNENKIENSIKNEEELKSKEYLEREGELKGQEELKKQEELKREEELKGQGEIEGQEELKKEEMEKQEEKKREEDQDQEELKKEEELKKQDEFKIDNHNYSKKNKPSFKCSICGKKFSSISSLKSHEKSKTKKHKFENYYGNYYYDNYQNYYYDNYYYNKCKTCGKTFNSSYALKNHCKDKKH